MKIIRRLLWVLPVIYMAMVWTMSSLPDDTFVELPDSSTDAFIKESLHLIEFAILYLLFVLAAYFNGKLTPVSNVVFAVLACLYGITDEIHQSFVPARSSSLIDVLKDIIGVTISYLIIKRKVAATSPH
ncbi:VanZ family protein [Neobacillus sp. D3-1R]|uniref:VanZ family protein n=1 Tax=Neobacillus sp. D3-1R TaxID=3445778 RepID=UPI003FA11704